MRVTPLAGESLGVRSMAVLVETPDVRLVVDPGCALVPRRFGLPPSFAEEAAFVAARDRIENAVLDADVLVASHYHWDHVSLDWEIYAGKTILAKSWRKDTNQTCAARGQTFEARWKHRAMFAGSDGDTFQVGETTIRLSPALPHGSSGSRLGSVVSTVVERGGRKFVHSSDVQGPMSPEATRWLLAESPDLLVLDGAPAYLQGSRVPPECIDAAAWNLNEVWQETGADILADHHILRGADYRTAWADVYDRVPVRTFAEYLGVPNRLLEAHRPSMHGVEKLPGVAPAEVQA